MTLAVECRASGAEYDVDCATIAVGAWCSACSHCRANRGADGAGEGGAELLKTAQASCPDDGAACPKLPAFSNQDGERGC